MKYGNCDSDKYLVIVSSHHHRTVTIKYSVNTSIIEVCLSVCLTYCSCEVQTSEEPQILFCNMVAKSNIL